MGQYSVGDHVTLPAGTKVGMDRLRADVSARIDQIQTASDGTPFYGVSWTDPKTGKRRTTWWAPTPEIREGRKTMGFKYAVRSNTVRDNAGQGMHVGWMEAYVYNADLYCEDCGHDLQEGKGDTGDSNDYPQGPYPDGGGESDGPQHCGSGAGCVNVMEFAGTKVGVWLGNPLTDDGVEALKEMLSNPRPSAYQLALHEFWSDVYSDYLEGWEPPAPEIPSPQLPLPGVRERASRGPNTPGYNTRLFISFTTDRSGKPLAYYWSGHGAPGTLGRWIRMPLDEARDHIAQGNADQAEYTRWAKESLAKSGVSDREPSFKRLGTRVKYVYTGGPVHAGTLGTIEGWLPTPYKAQIRWDNGTMSSHTPDEFEVVPRKSHRAHSSTVRDYEGMTYEQWLQAARSHHDAHVHDNSVARLAYSRGIDPHQFVEMYGGFALEEAKSAMTYSGSDIARMHNDFRNRWAATVKGIHFEIRELAEPGYYARKGVRPQGGGRYRNWELLADGKRIWTHEAVDIDPLNIAGGMLEAQVENVLRQAGYQHERAQ